MNNEKLVRNVLRTFPKRFSHKVTTIEEERDLTIMRIDELIGNLTTFEMMFESSESNKKKRIALKEGCEDEDEEDLAEIMSLLAKSFNKTLKCFNKKSYSGGNNPGVNDKRTDKGWKNSKSGGSTSGFNQQNKGNGNVERSVLVQKNQELTRLVEEQRVKICVLEEKNKAMNKCIKMMNSSNVVLDEILLQGKRSGDNTRIGFSEENSKKRLGSPFRKWVAAGTQISRTFERKITWRCYHYEKKGTYSPLLL
ncbi:hypothetical protein LIER_36062 [Lithospermum erythrorhizon]|uniref:Gag-pol polyprotein n=1 Tax=Lithospermum erythrorhizon TaxID=34254 RepID=A0AAV3P216_LITER